MATVFLIPVLLLIFWQDLKLRAVWWFLFPLMMALAFWKGSQTVEAENILYNLVFLVSCMIALTFYVSARQGRWTMITEGFFSWGDILFLIALIPLFSFYIYLLFFTVGTILSLMMHGIVLIFNRRQKTIPFAGYMALFLIPYLLFDKQLNQFIYQYF